MRSHNSFKGAILMSDDYKEVVIKIDKEIYGRIEEYSHKTDQSEDLVLNRILGHSLKQFEKGYADLKQGYIDMGKINLEISREFTVSENEALTYINIKSIEE